MAGNTFCISGKFHPTKQCHEINHMYLVHMSCRYPVIFNKFRISNRFHQSSPFIFHHIFLANILSCLHSDKCSLDKVNMSHLVAAYTWVSIHRTRNLCHHFGFSRIPRNFHTVHSTTTSIDLCKRQ